MDKQHRMLKGGYHERTSHNPMLKGSKTGTNSTNNNNNNNNSGHHHTLTRYIPTLLYLFSLIAEYIHSFSTFYLKLSINRI